MNFLTRVVTGSGPAHYYCLAAFKGNQDQITQPPRPVEERVRKDSENRGKGMRSRERSPATSATMRILGALLRFLGMAVIIGSAILFFLTGVNDGGPLIFALVGAGLHFAGRKLAPDAHWASATGGAVAGVGSIALIVAVILGLFFINRVLKSLGFS